MTRERQEAVKVLEQVSRFFCGEPEAAQIQSVIKLLRQQDARERALVEKAASKQRYACWLGVASQGVSEAPRSVRTTPLVTFDEVVAAVEGDASGTN